jgi:very-short-patch-repair endonuclease
MPEDITTWERRFASCSSLAEPEWVKKTAKEHREFTAKFEDRVESWFKTFGVRAMRQVPIGGFIADFVVPKYAVVVEIDGSHHYEDPTQLEWDQKRDFWLSSIGFSVFRIPRGLLVGATDMGYQIVDMLLSALSEIKPPGPQSFIGIAPKRRMNDWNGFKASQNNLQSSPKLAAFAAVFPRSLSLLPSGYGSVLTADPDIVMPTRTARLPRDKTEALLQVISHPDNPIQKSLTTEEQLLSMAITAARGIMVGWFKQADIVPGTANATSALFLLATKTTSASKIANVLILALSMGRNEVKGLVDETTFNLSCLLNHGNTKSAGTNRGGSSDGSGDPDGGLVCRDHEGRVG